MRSAIESNDYKPLLPHATSLGKGAARVFGIYGDYSEASGDIESIFRRALSYNAEGIYEDLGNYAGDASASEDGKYVIVVLLTSYVQCAHIHDRLNDREKEAYDSLVHFDSQMHSFFRSATQEVSNFFYITVSEVSYI